MQTFATSETGRMFRFSLVLLDVDQCFHFGMNSTAHFGSSWLLKGHLRFCPRGLGLGVKLQTWRLGEHIMGDVVFVFEYDRFAVMNREISGRKRLILLRNDLGLASGQDADNQSPYPKQGENIHTTEHRSDSFLVVG